jgi:peptidoglycan/LPS O-acetylase OafA/YrhL
MGARRLPTLSDLDFRNNAIGFLRLFFATVVVWYHVGLGNFSPGHLPSGFLAVAGFFVLSGLLITRSFEKVQSPGRFLWHRFLRIMPAFWVCLFAVAFVFAPLAFVYEHGNLAGFSSQSPSPWGYVMHNSALQMNQGTIGSLIQGLPEPKFLNGSLWTLEWEFLCYVTVLAVGILGLFKRYGWLNLVLLAIAYLYASIGLASNPPAALPFIYVIAELGVFFWIGACAYMYRDRLVMSGPLAILCAVAVVVASPRQAAAFLVIPSMAYATLYAAMALPIRSFDRRFDFSYGLYIYAYPVQQLFSIYGLNHYGVAAYFFASLFTALLFAAASWFGIERVFLSLKNYGLKPRAAESTLDPSLDRARASAPG